MDIYQTDRIISYEEAKQIIRIFKSTKYVIKQARGNFNKLELLYGNNKRTFKCELHGGELINSFIYKLGIDSLGDLKGQEILNWESLEGKTFGITPPLTGEPFWRKIIKENNYPLATPDSEAIRKSILANMYVALKKDLGFK